MIYEENIIESLFKVNYFMCCSSTSWRHNLMRLVDMDCLNYIDRYWSVVSIFWHYWAPVGISIKGKKKKLKFWLKINGTSLETMQPYMEAPWYDSLDGECWLQIISFVEPPWKIFQAYHPLRLSYLDLGDFESMSTLKALWQFPSIACAVTA